MSYNWNEYLTFAKDLENGKSTHTNYNLTCSLETVDRCIVSRSYYATFHYAKKYAETQSGFAFPKKEIHETIRQWFYDNGKRQTFFDLREFSKWRNHCDYDDSVPNLSGLIRDSRKMAGKILHAF